MSERLPVYLSKCQSTCSHVDWQLYFYNILFDQIRQYKKALIEIVSIDTTVLKAFTFLFTADLSSKLTNEPANNQNLIYAVLLRTACYALTEWFYAAWFWLKNRTVLWAMTLYGDPSSKLTVSTDTVMTFMQVRTATTSEADCCPNLFSSSSILVAASLSMLIANLPKKKCVAPCL